MDKYVDFYKFMEVETKSLFDLFLQKNAGQYAHATNNPLINFEMGCLMKYKDISPELLYEIAHDYMRKHLAYLETSSVSSNKISESLTDIAAYSLILKYLVMKYEELKKTENTACVLSNTEPSSRTRI